MQVVITIPVYKSSISLMELASLNQLINITKGKYPVRLIAPEDLNVSCYMEIIPSSFDVKTERFPNRFFQSTNGYNKLWMNPMLYSRISGWKYVLIYHLDAFLFRDELAAWCETGYDSIGAPIYEFNETSTPDKYLGTGNGGFCLRNIDSCIKVLSENKILFRYKDIKKDFLMYNCNGRLSRGFYYLDMMSTLGSRSSAKNNRIRVNEDYFWSVLVPVKFTWFKVPSRSVAAMFSIEYNQESLFTEMDGVLPFGCHGWYKPLLKQFWKPIFLRIGINID